MAFEVKKSTRNQPKVYRALLTQSGTDAPVATVLENTLGGSVAWSYNASGDYRGTLTGAFLSGKTLVFGVLSDGGTALVARRFSNDALVWTTYSDDMLFNTPIEILVYP